MPAPVGRLRGIRSSCGATQLTLTMAVAWVAIHERRASIARGREDPPVSVMPDPEELARPWVAAYPPGVPPTYRMPPVPLTRFLDDAARDFPDVTATRWLGASIDYAQLRASTDQLAAALARLGVVQGSHVAVALPNLPAFVLVAFATWRLGAVLIPLPPDLADPELLALLEESEAEVLVAQTTAVPQVNRLRPRLPLLAHVITTGAHEWLSRRRRLLAPVVARRAGWYRRLRPDDDVLPMSRLLGEAAPEVRQAAVGPQDTAAILFTGGTTGERKGVVLSHGNLVANTFQARLWVPDIQAGRERILAVLPLSHAYGLTMCMLTAVLTAGTLVLLPDLDVGRMLDAIDRERPTLLPGAPVIYRALADAPDVTEHDLGSIRACVSGGAPLPASVATDFERLTSGARLREGYGLTEASPLTHANPIYGRHEHGAIGLPVTGTVAVVVDPDDPGRVLPTGMPGVLAVHGPQVMQGYWRRPEETAAVLRDGWLLTGDIAVRDEQGAFRIVDRAADVVWIGQQQVFPTDVEEVLAAHPAVAAAAVVGLGDPARLKAFVVLGPRTRVEPATLLAHCREHLPPAAVPDEIQVRDTLPHNVLGKVLRRVLVDEEVA